MSTVFMVLADYDHTHGELYCVDESIELLGIYPTIEEAEERQREIEAKHYEIRAAYGYGDFDAKRNSNLDKHDRNHEQLLNHQISYEEFEAKERELSAEEDELLPKDVRRPDNGVDDMYLCMTACYIKEVGFSTPIEKPLFSVSYYE